MEDKSVSAMEVKKFLEQGSARGPIQAGEFMAFWKSCSDEEKAQFTKEVRSLQQ